MKTITVQIANPLLLFFFPPPHTGDLPAAPRACVLSIRTTQRGSLPTWKHYNLDKNNNATAGFLFPKKNNVCQMKFFRVSDMDQEYPHHIMSGFNHTLLIDRWNWYLSGIILYRNFLSYITCPFLKITFSEWSDGCHSWWFSSASVFFLMLGKVSEKTSHT